LQNRIIDLSYAAAHKLGYVGAGHTRVRIELILPAEFQDPVVGHKQEPDELAQLLNQVTSSASATAVAVTPASPGSGVPSLGASVHSTGVFLQLGAFSSQDNAQASVQKMVRLFPALEGLIKHDAQGGLFRVRAGPYASIESANLQAENIFAVTGLRPLRVTEKLNH
jgi:rare lipoprotein A